jgi:hypothetical protein
MRPTSTAGVDPEAALPCAHRLPFDELVEVTDACSSRDRRSERASPLRRSGLMNYSSRSATSGSTRDARSAGSSAASSTADSTTAKTLA